MASGPQFILFLVGLVLPFSCCLSVVTVPPPPKLEATTISVKQFEDDYYKAFQTYVSTRLVSEELKRLNDVIQKIDKEIILEEIPNVDMPHQCLQCRAASYSFIQYNDTFNSDTNKLKAIALDLCSVLSLDAGSVCEGFIEAVTPTVGYILRNSSRIDADRVCSIWLQSNNCAENDRLSDTFPVNLPVPEAPLQSKRAADKSSATPLVIVHLSDFHFDPYYAPGANAKCAEYVCCRSINGLTNVTANGAGYWGDYRPCDSPWHTVEDIVARVKAEYKHIDMIYYTGDIVDHFSWNSSMAHNTASVRKMTAFFIEQFPGIPIYPVLGNHEAHPSNSFAPSYAMGENISTRWLFDLIYDLWGPLLPDQESRETLRDGGYYSTIIRPKLRLIAINNNFCFYANIWLLHSTDYFADYLHWFRDELAKATENGEKVHVISHVPSNDHRCFKGWAREYRKIVEEFSETIVAIFNGHTHEDEFNVYYSQRDPSKATGVAFNGGSGTTFAYFNSNFKVYSVDNESYEVLNYDAWHYNLTEANLFPNRPPAWQKTYSFKEAYNLEDLSPKSMDGLVQRLGSDRELLKTYWERKEKYSDWFLAEGCDDKCLKKNFCDIVTMVHGDDAKCEELYKL